MPTPKPSRLSCRLIFLSSVLSLCLICSALLSAQGTGGRILGRASDASGAVLSGVRVTLANEATGVSHETVTNDSGDYGFPQVPVGAYRLEFDLAGFKKSVQRGVNVDLNQVVTVNSVLQIGGTKETVEVTSEAPLVDTSSTQLGAIMDSRQVSNLPLNSRDTYQLLQLQPGVMSTVGSSNTLVYGSDSAGAVSVNGGRGRSNNFSVNGGDANDLFANLPTVQPSPEMCIRDRCGTDAAPLLCCPRRATPCARRDRFRAPCAWAGAPIGYSIPAHRKNLECWCGSSVPAGAGCRRRRSPASVRGR